MQPNKRVAFHERIPIEEAYHRITMSRNAAKKEIDRRRKRERQARKVQQKQRRN